MTYFTKIDQSVHPNYKLFKKNIFTTQKKLIFNKRIDNQIIKDIIYNLKFNKKDSLFGGAWQNIDVSARKKLIISLNNQKNLRDKFSNFFRNSFSFGLISSHWEQKNKKNWERDIISNILKNISAWEEFCMSSKIDYKYLDSKNDPGNPYGLNYKNNLILFDTPRHDYYAKKITNILRNCKDPLIIEIGGGYGGLLSQLLKRKFSFSYINIDLPQSLAVAYYYIKKKFNKKILFSRKLKKIDLKKNKFIFMPFSNDIFDMPKLDTSLVFNSNSFSEMNKNISTKYFNLINKILKPKYIMHQNSNYLLYPDSKLHIEIQSSDFNIDYRNYNSIYSFPSIFQGGSGRYREYLFERK